MNKFVLTIAAFIALNITRAQEIVRGPIVGGVTHEKAVVFVMASEQTNVTVEVSDNLNFTNPITVTAATIPSIDNGVKMEVTGLSPYTQYFVRAKINGNVSGPVSRFRSFPIPGTPGNYKIVGGSCMRTLDDNDSTLFNTMRNENADVFIQYGDWGYPDNTGTTDVYQSNPATTWAANPFRITQHYKNAFGSTNSGSFLRSIAIDHVWDDHDYINDNSGGNFSAAYCIPSPFPIPGFNPNVFCTPIAKPITIQMPLNARTNLIEGYQNFFPHYELNNPMQDGIYHKYMIGNTEVFVLDLRSNRTSQHEAIKNSGGTWSYQPPADHKIMSDTQKQWLLDGLSNSTATWKVIISSVTWNYGNTFGFDTCLSVGSGAVPLFQEQIASVFPLPGGIDIVPGYLGAARYADKWAGFKQCQQQVMDHILGNDIRNVFFMSGDTHNAGIDDGTYSGIPELMSGNLKVSNRGEARESMQFYGYNIWNIGGTGICDNDKFVRTYGKIEVFGEDSLQLSIIDPNGEVIAKGNFLKDEPYKYDPNFVPNRIPIPANDQATTNKNESVTIDVLANDIEPENDPLYVIIPDGSADQPANGTVVVNPDNTVTYTPNTDYVGPDAFRYKACDVNGFQCECCVRATVFVDVKDGLGVVETDKLAPVFNLFPNPAKDFITFSTDKKDPNFYTLTVFDATGRKASEVMIMNTATVFVSHWKSGLYFYNINNNEGSIIQNGKFIVQ